MKKVNNPLHRIIMAALAATPTLALAVPPAGTSYFTDPTDSYVQDQTSQIMGSLNNVLCYMGSMAPDLMVNAGDYIALVDSNACDNKGSGGQSSNTGASYVTSVVNSSRASNANPMIVKAWLHPPQASGDYVVYASAKQAPTTSLPYGEFRMDFCGGASCAMGSGFINAASTGGLTFYEFDSGGGGTSTTQLALNASSSTAGSGAASQSWTWGTPGSMTFTFQYNSNYFVRNDGSGVGDVCFDRRPANATESVWDYGLYDNNGAHVNRNSGFPIEYVDTTVTPNVSYQGFMGYYGLWMPFNVPGGSTVNQVTYSNNGATKTPYTLLKSGGKLTKFTTASKTLDKLDKIRFWYFAQTNWTSGTATFTSGSQYELYWNNTAGAFVVSGKQGTSGNMEPYANPITIGNAAMVTNNAWGLFGWSQMTGGQFGITGTDLAKINNLVSTPSTTIAVKVQIQDVVYPDQYASVGSAGNLGKLVCINDCPTAALITTSNGGTGTAYPTATAGWTPIANTSFTTYALNGTTGNIADPAGAAVVSTATSGINAYGVRSGRMVSVADSVTLQSNKTAAGVCGVGVTCTTFNQGDVDFLPVGSSYYVWETGGQPWNSLAVLKDSTGASVLFDAPLNVNFSVPNDMTKYGNYANASIILQYGGFGNLWGIPNTCVDLLTNGACVFTQPAAYQQQNFRWTPNFNIPFDQTLGVVSATVSGAATTYYVKPLNKEVRLANVTCAAAGLSTNGLTTGTLPVSTDFQDPTSKVGTKPTVTAAPRVIQGVKQY